MDNGAAGGLMGRVLQWREEHVTDRQAVLILAFAIGFLASVAAFVLHAIIHAVQAVVAAGLTKTSFNWLYLVFPVVGIFLTSLFVKYVVRDNISHGITRILYAISSNRSRLKAHNTWTSVVASAVTIGFGGSVGAEAPIVLTGSAIGSNLGRIFRMDNKTLMLLVGCGAAAAIAGIFKAPIAGLVFTLEVLMVDLSMASLLPILVSSVTAACFTYLFVGGNALFTFHLDQAWSVERVPASILLGVTCGLVSLYFIRTMTACEGVFARLKGHAYYKLALGGAALSVLISLFPALYGEGYTALNILLNGSSPADWDTLLDNSLFYGHGALLPLYVLLVVLTKVVATSATNGAGGCGGTFAPSLFVGGFGGFLFSRLWNTYTPWAALPEKNFTLLGMAGVIAAVMHAPLTGVFLIAELTGGYQLFIPLIIVCVSAVITISLFEPHGIYSMRLACIGKLVTHNTDSAALTLMTLDMVVEREYTPVRQDDTLGRLVRVVSQSPTNFIPVTDAAGRMAGLVDIANIRHIMFRTELYQRFTVGQVMSPADVLIGKDDPVAEAMAKFERGTMAYLPVVAPDGTLAGFVSRTRLYSMYRKMVADLSEE